MKNRNEILLFGGFVIVCTGIISLLFGKKILAMAFDTYIVENKTAFLAKVNDICQKLNIKADWLMAVMAFESGINHTKVNSVSGATGLIQFMPSTANGLGTTTAALKAMTNVQQLDYVYKYLSKYANKVKCFTDTYLTVFYPSAVGKADSYVIGATGSAIANQNPAFKNSEGAVTVGSVKAYMTNWVAKKGVTIL